MARSYDQQEVFWPPPVQGMVLEQSYVQQPVQFARFLRNFVVTPGNIRVRGEQKLWYLGLLPAVSGEFIMWSDVANNDFLWTDGVIRNVVGSTTDTTTLVDCVPFESTFLDQLFLSFAGFATRQRNGSTWGAFAYTLATLTSSEIRGGVGFKGKMYFWGTDATDGEEYIEYGGLRSVSGATTSYGVSAFLQPSETITFCRVPTIENGITTGNVFVVFGSKGTVLVYDGNDPSDWVLIGQFRMSSPLGRFSFLDIQGDVMVMTLQNIYSLRALFAGGSQAAELSSITRPVQQFYQTIAQRLYATTDSPGSGENYQPFGAFFESENAMVFSLGKADGIIPNNDSEYTLNGAESRRIQLVYFRETQALAVWDIPNLAWPVRSGTFTGVDGLMPIWAHQRAVYYYDVTGAQYGKDQFFNADEAAAVFDQVESVWTTPILTAKPMQNALTSGIRIFFFQDDGPIISAAGFVGAGSDLSITTRLRFRRDGDFISDKGSVVLLLGSPENDLVHELYGSVGLQEYFQSAYMRINKLTKAHSGTNYDIYTATRRTHIFGMTAYFQQGGIF